MYILLTNDDGLNAHGLQRLLRWLRRDHDVVVYAPSLNQSGASHSITLRKPVKVEEQRPGEFSVGGTPADSVYMAVSAGVKPDMVISGINAGANMGCDTLYSGTVAAAMEARFLGVPAMALSLDCAPGDRADHDSYDTACEIASRLIATRQQWTAEEGMTVLNVNVPDAPFRDIAGMHWTRLGRRGLPQPAEPWPGEQGAWQVGLAGPAEDAAPETDFHAVASGAVSLTPLQQDLTASNTLRQLQNQEISL